LQRLKERVTDEHSERATEAAAEGERAENTHIHVRQTAGLHGAVETAGNWRMETEKERQPVTNQRNVREIM